MKSLIITNTSFLLLANYFYLYLSVEVQHKNLLRINIYTLVRTVAFQVCRMMNTPIGQG